MADILYNKALEGIFDDTINLVNDTIKVMLVTSAYSPDKDHDFVTASGAGAAELSGTGYTGGYGGSGRVALTSQAAAEVDASDNAKMTIASVVFPACGPAGTAAGALFIKETGGSDATSRLIAYIDTGFPGAGLITNGSDITISFPSNILFTMAQA